MPLYLEPGAQLAVHSILCLVHADDDPRRFYRTARAILLALHPAPPNDGVGHRRWYRLHFPRPAIQRAFPAGDATTSAGYGGVKVWPVRVPTGGNSPAAAWSCAKVADATGGNRLKDLA